MQGVCWLLCCLLQVEVGVVRALGRNYRFGIEGLKFEEGLSALVRISFFSNVSRPAKSLKFRACRRPHPPHPAPSLEVFIQHSQHYIPVYRLFLRKKSSGKMYLQAPTIRFLGISHFGARTLEPQSSV